VPISKKIGNVLINLTLQCCFRGFHLLNAYISRVILVEIEVEVEVEEKIWEYQKCCHGHKISNSLLYCSTAYI